MREFIVDKCELIAESIGAVKSYFEKIHSVNDFAKVKNGSLYLDAVMMPLPAIGKNVKKISQLQEDFFSSLLHFYINNMIRFRDFIPPDYVKSNSDIVFEICQFNIPELKQKITHFLKEQPGE